MGRQRKIARVNLGQPITAVACGDSVQIVDASLRGVRVAHKNLLSERERCEVAFDWNGREIEFTGRICWTKPQSDSSPPAYQSGLEISTINDRSIDGLRSLIQSFVERVLAEQKANARGIPRPADGASVRRKTLYARHELIDGIWRKSITPDPRQPEFGFTMPATESPDQIELLRSAYAAADGPMRDVIRRLAELSLPERTGTS